VCICVFQFRLSYYCMRLHVNIQQFAPVDTFCVAVDRPEMVEARKVWQSTHDAGNTLSALRGFHCTERQLLEGLKRSAKNDIVNALSNVCPLSIGTYPGLSFFKIAFYKLSDILCHISFLTSVIC